MANGTDERFEMEGFGLKVRGPTKRMAEMFSMAMVFVVAGLGYMLYAHSEDTKKSANSVESAITKANERTVGAINESMERQERLLQLMLRETRRQTCLQEFDMNERKEKREFCKEMSRRD